MTKKRTKEQVAFDGVKTSWRNDPFTEILDHQVRTQFSIDGVVAPENSGVSRESDGYVVSIKQKDEKVSVVGVGGIRLLWKKAFAI